MELAAASLKEQPFRIHGKPVAFVQYESQTNAHEFLTRIRNHSTGLGILMGPALSGKSALIRHFVETQKLNSNIAVLDGSGLNTTTLLEAILQQFGFPLEGGSVNELLNMLRVFASQRTASGTPPMLIIENSHALNPSALQVLRELMQLKVRQKSAMRLVLASDRDISRLFASPDLSGLVRLIVAECHLGPLAAHETANFLHEKLNAAGCPNPLAVIPADVCAEFHRASGGWPGILDRLALLALANATSAPVRIEHVEHPVLPENLLTPAGHPAAKAVGSGDEKNAGPRLVLSLNGAIVKDLKVSQERLIIGRTEHSDLTIDSRFVSRHHALLVRHGGTTLLMDLNSTNGTYVNSRRISNQVLAHDDIVSIGNYRLKFIHRAAGRADLADNSDFSDTVILKTLQDMRQILTSENTQIMFAAEPSQATKDS